MTELQSALGKDLSFGEEVLSIIAKTIRDIDVTLPHNWCYDENSWVWNMRVDVDVHGSGFKAGEIRAHPDGWLAFYPEGWS